MSEALSPHSGALLSAALHGDEAALSHVLEGEPAEPLLRAADEQGYTALHLAARAGHEGCVRRLMTAGAALDAGGAGEEGDTPLIAACGAGTSLHGREHGGAARGAVAATRCVPALQ